MKRRQTNEAARAAARVSEARLAMGVVLVSRFVALLSIRGILGVLGLLASKPRRDSGAEPILKGPIELSWTRSDDNAESRSMASSALSTLHARCECALRTYLLTVEVEHVGHRCHCCTQACQDGNCIMHAHVLVERVADNYHASRCEVSYECDRAKCRSRTVLI